MRFKRGSKVEVKDRNDSGVSWRRAEILSGKGNMYTVIYDDYPGMDSRERIERVSRRDIRSCVPPLQGVDNREIGQVVEVLDDYSWKTASVMKVLNRDYYLVRLSGCLEELSVHRSNTRVIQNWQDEKWNLIGNGSVLCARHDQDSALKTSKKVSKVPSFRASNGFHVGDIQEVEATERGFKRQRVMAATLKGQGDVIANCKKNMMDKYVHVTVNGASDGYCALELTKRSGDVGYSVARSTESNDCHTHASSVGSCSINDKFPSRSHNISAEVHRQGTDLLCSDAESFQYSADKVERYPFSSEKKVAARIHTLELQAYRCTLEALYASGPLSWDQEALLTNLRIALHISNDEHLTELRTLISASTGINVC